MDERNVYTRVERVEERTGRADVSEVGNEKVQDPVSLAPSFPSRLQPSE